MRSAASVRSNRDPWLARIGPKAARERRIGNLFIIAGIALGVGVVIVVLLKTSHALPPELVPAAKAYMVVFGIYGALMGPCGWLPMYRAAGRSAARFLGPAVTELGRIPVAWLRDPIVFDRSIEPRGDYPSGKADPRHDALVAGLKQRGREGSGW